MKQDWEGCLSCPDLKVRVKGHIVLLWNIIHSMIVENT